MESGGDPLRTFDPTSPLLVLGAGAVVPLGVDGWSFNPEYTYSRSQPEPAGGSPASIGYFQRFALRTSYSLIRTRTKTFTLTGALEYVTQNVALPLFGTDLNNDRYGVLRIGATYEIELPWGAGLQTSTTFSRGLGGRDGADADASGIPLSRQGAGPFFNKANVDAHLTSPLPLGFRVNLTGRAQTSFGEPLLVSEQFSLDGPQAVSAYPNGTFSVDEGVTLRSELSRPFAMSGFVVPATVSPYVFAAFGAGILDDPTVDEVAAIRAGAVGVGLRTFIETPGGYQGATLELEAAKQFSNLRTLTQGWRGNISVSRRF
jgi:hemolysin activation/secretion protein